jgi:hypothetical protein
MAHARRYFFELAKDGKSPVAATALKFVGQPYGIEREVRTMPSEQRLHESMVSGWACQLDCRLKA